MLPGSRDAACPAQLTGASVVPLQSGKQTAILQFLVSKLASPTIGLTSLRVTGVRLCPVANDTAPGAPPACCACRPIVFCTSLTHLHCHAASVYPYDAIQQLSESHWKTWQVHG